MNGCSHYSKCLNCKIKFKYEPGLNNAGKFCSTSCCGNYRSKEAFKRNKSLFKKGELKNRKVLRLILFTRRKKKCSICKRTKWNGKPISLWLDHIDGNAGNNVTKNLRFLCLNCDAQTATHGIKNLGKGRKSRGLDRS